ncbi:hypothetical protein [Roseateles depolymerans]|nr:hypothetical protein [Roseateles depolymerans]
MKPLLRGSMFRLTPSERQTLTGPFVVGCVLGICAAAASWGFDREYQHISDGLMLLGALEAFVAGVAVVIIPLAVLPIVVRRLMARKAVKAVR